MDIPSILPTAEPFFFPRGRTGCLLVHGFTGAPKEMRWLGEDLALRGYSVLGVRLAGHATRIEDLQRAHWEDWLFSVEDGWNLLAGQANRIFVMGLSMGGVLSLLFAANHPVAGVVAMSTPHHLPPDPRLPYARALSKLMPGLPKGQPDWHDARVADDHVEYPLYPTRAIAELRDLLVEMRAALPRVTVPALLIHSRDDGSVRAEEGHPDLIYQALGSQDKQLLWVEGSGHVIVRDAARSQVFQMIADFIQRLEGSAAPAP